jgi:mRNA interferase MazF
MALLNGFKETETEQQYRRGEIYYINNASKEHIGSEMKKDRPAVIVSCDANNKHSDVLEVVFLTSAPKKDLPTHVTIRSTGRKSEALCEQPTPVSVERINNFVGKASEKEMEQIDIALLIGLGIKLAGAENQSGGPHENLNSRFRAA